MNQPVDHSVQVSPTYSPHESLKLLLGVCAHRLSGLNLVLFTHISEVLLCGSLESRDIECIKCEDVSVRA